MDQRVAVLAVGGNSLISDSAHTSVRDQTSAAQESMSHVASMIEQGWNVVVTHGNGPQVGFLLRRAEIAQDELPSIPLDVLGADTQGATGYMFVTALRNEFTKRGFKAKGIDADAVSIVTQTVVDQNDPAFSEPSKPIGSFLSQYEARKHATEDGWSVVEDSGRGWRRVVASPEPVRIVELEAIRSLVNDGYTVVSAGGGGIPVIEADDGTYAGVEAVIDKDLASALLANDLKADLLLISTAVEGVAINFGTPEETWLSEITADQARAYLAEGHFGKGSMGPKVAAALTYLDNGGKQVIITSPPKIAEALAGKAGTSIVP